MNELPENSDQARHPAQPGQQAQPRQSLDHEPFEQRARELFERSVADLDLRLRSRLTQARHAALDAAANKRSWLPRVGWWWTSAAGGVTAAAVLGVMLWTGGPLGTMLGPRAVSLADAQANIEDLDLVASSDASGDALEMLQDDLDFYDFADRATNPETAA